MSSATEDAAISTPVEETPDQVTPPSLQDRFPESCQMTRRTFAVVATLVAAYWALSFVPLWNTDVWGHLAYGRLIATRGAIPDTEPLMPLSHGVRFVDSNWIAQVFGFAAYERFGPTALQSLHALLLTLGAGFIALRVSQRTQSALWAVLAIGLFFWSGWQQLHIARPQSAGIALFCLMLFLLTGRQRRSVCWTVTPIAFGLWANVHGSFVVGLALIGVFVAGRAFDLLRRTKSPASLLHDRKLATSVVMLELAAAAALLNPYGFQLYADVLAFSHNPNLASIPEWQPLTIDMIMGRWLVLGSLLLVFSYRFTPRRVSTFEVLLLIGTTLAALSLARLYLWWFPVAVLLLCRNGQAIVRQRWNLERTVSPRKGLWTVAAAGLVWIGFAYTPFGLRVLHGIEPEIERVVAPQTPVKLAAYLNENPPDGLVLNSFEYGDYLLFAGPRDLKLMAMSHLHLIPEHVWNDYLRMIRVGDGWDETLDRYGVNTVIVDRSRDRPLMMKLSRHDDWKVDYADARSVMFHRVTPL